MNDGKDLVENRGVEETQEEPQTSQTVGAVSRWITGHPRHVLWFVVLALIPYILLCWGATFVMLGALMSGGCG